MNVQPITDADRARMEEKEMRRRRIQVRRALEIRIVNRLLKLLLKDGCSVTLSYGDGDDVVIKSRKFTDFHADIMACDQEWLRVYKNDKHIGTVFLVYGNEGHDVICDYHNSLSSYIEEVDKFIKTIMRW